MRENLNKKPSSLENLASGDPLDRRRGAFDILKRAGSEFADQPELVDRLREAFLAEWREIGSWRGELVAPLVTTLTTDRSLLEIEVAAMALATQGEDGLTALIDLLEHPDFAVRSKVVIGVGLLDRSSRWAVSRLVRALSGEPVEFVVGDLVRALGRIGGGDAKRALTSLIEQVQSGEREDQSLLEVAKAALTHIERQEALESDR